jgi:CrcB protein
MIALYIAFGGAMGALARFGVHQWMLASGVSALGLSTLTVNVLGSFAMGCCFIAFERLSISEALRLGLMVGFLGAFTTFSTFSLELLTELQGGNYLRPGIYAVSSVLLCLFGCYVGFAVTRAIID